MTIMSVPRALRNRPDTASMSEVITLLIQVTMPSKIQSSKVITSVRA